MLTAVILFISGAAESRAGTGVGTTEFTTRVADQAIPSTIWGEWSRPRASRLHLSVAGSNVPGTISTGQARAVFSGPVVTNGWCVRREFSYSSLAGGTIGQITFELIRVGRRGGRRSLGSVQSAYGPTPPSGSFAGGLAVIYLGTAGLRRGERMIVAVKVILDGDAESLSEDLEASYRCKT